MNKICTSIEQSEKLMKFLPSESADMHYWKLDWNTYRLSVGHSKEWQEGYEVKKMVYIPCWSQAALYNILPVVIGNLLEKNALRLRMDKGENDFNVWYENIDTRCVEDGLDVIESNPIDAYFEMICKLHERKLI